MNMATTQTTKPTLLVVDDTPENISILSSLLKENYRIKVATNGAKAIEIALAGAPPDLMLLDIMMPEMDGYEVCQRFKQDERLRDVPIIFLSALSDATDKVRAFQVGGVDYVTKPFQAEEVRARVETHLKMRELQAELQRQNVCLQESYEKLQALSQQKDEFIRIASHDLKNPITCILGFAFIVESMVAPGAIMTEQAHGAVSKIKTHCRVMQKIIGDFLDFHAMEDGQFTLATEATDLNELLRAAHESNSAYASGKQIALNLDLSVEPVTITCDKARIGQVVENFVSNAIKFSEQGANVHIHSSLAADRARVEIRDSGPGLTEEDMQKLFQKYAKLSNKPTGGEKSSGLGLAIAKKIVDLHGGSIGARNNPDGGAAFWFELPI